MIARTAQAAITGARTTGGTEVRTESSSPNAGWRTRFVHLVLR